MRLSCHSAPLSGIDHMGCDPRIWQLAAVSGGPWAVRPLAKLSRVLHDGDGEYIRRQCRPVVTRLFGDRLDRYIVTVGAMTRAVLYGILITAFAQGLIAGT